MFKLFFGGIKTERNLLGCRQTFKEEVAFKNLTVSQGKLARLLLKLDFYDPPRNYIPLPLL